MTELGRRTFIADELTLTKHEMRLRDEICEWIPERIFDSHAHNYLAHHVLDDSIPKHVISTYVQNSVQDSLVWRTRMFPGKTVQSLRFGHVEPGLDFRSMNAWLRQATLPNDRFAVFGLQWDVPYTLDQMRSGTAALKQYYLSSVPPSEHILGCFPPSVLEEAAFLGVPIILHLPRPLPDSLPEVEALVGRFPKLLVVLAHAGVALKHSTGLDLAYRQLAQHNNVWFDTALVDDVEVLRSLGMHCGTERILFGSDEPICMIRARTYLHPELGPRLAPRRPYRWTDPDEFKSFGHLGSDAVHWHWDALMALKQAFYGWGGPVVERIFLRNAEALFG